MTTLIIVTLLVLVISQTILVGVVLVMYRGAREHLSTAMAISHFGCTQQVSELVSAKHDAVLLRNLADEYDAVENQAVLDRMRYTMRVNPEYATGNRTIPALWLRDKADEMDPEEIPDPIYNLAGDRVV